MHFAGQVFQQMGSFQAQQAGHWGSGPPLDPLNCFSADISSDLGRVELLLLTGLLVDRAPHPAPNKLSNGQLWRGPHHRQGAALVFCTAHQLCMHLPGRPHARSRAITAPSSAAAAPGPPPPRLQVYANPQELWEAAQREAAAQDSSSGEGQWYTKAVQYWDEQEASGGPAERGQKTLRRSAEWLLSCGAAERLPGWLGARCGRQGRRGRRALHQQRPPLGPNGCEGGCARRGLQPGPGRC